MLTLALGLARPRRIWKSVRRGNTIASRRNTHWPKVFHLQTMTPEASVLMSVQVTKIGVVQQYRKDDVWCLELGGGWRRNTTNFTHLPQFPPPPPPPLEPTCLTAHPALPSVFCPLPININHSHLRHRRIVASSPRRHLRRSSLITS